jgi:hypothetical protein
MIRVFLAGLGYAVTSGFILAFALLVATPVDANGLHPRCNIDWPCASTDARVRPGHVARRIARADRFRNVEFGSPMYPPETARSWLNGLSKPARYISGRLICAINVNAALAERGIRGTGSALAHSFDHWGRASSPTPGAVAVTDRRGGGHVAIVSRVEGGRVFVWNPSSRGRGWREVEYTNRRARYRVAG